jgi:hypothetical protein
MASLFLLTLFFVGDTILGFDILFQKRGLLRELRALNEQATQPSGIFSTEPFSRVFVYTGFGLTQQELMRISYERQNGIQRCQGFRWVRTPTLR